MEMEQIQKYLDKHRTVKNTYSNEKATKLASFFGSSWYNDKKMYIQGSPMVLNFTTQEEAKANHEAKIKSDADTL